MENKNENFENTPPEPAQQNNKDAEILSPAEIQKKELDRIKQEAEENYNFYLRSLADAENLRKRLLKEVESSKRFALEGFFRDVLVVLDGFDKALTAQNSLEGASSFHEGVAIVRKQLFDILERNGLQEIASEGKKFDPNLHQAIKRTESSDVSEEIIECEYAKGYKMFDKLLRPAIVSVLVPGNSERP
jgi:molecular chaperone GrpE